MGSDVQRNAESGTLWLIADCRHIALERERERLGLWEKEVQVFFRACFEQFRGLFTRIAF